MQERRSARNACLTQSKQIQRFKRYVNRPFIRCANQELPSTTLENLEEQHDESIDEYPIDSSHLNTKVKHITQTTQLIIKIALVLILLPLVSSNGIYMTLSSSNLYVGSTSNYTISFNRSLNSLGQQITQSSLSSSYLISIIFDSSYNVSSSISITPTTYTVNTNTNTATLSLTSVINTITINSITNPLPSLTPLKITLNFYNSSSSSVIIDTCSSTLTFQTLSLSSSAVSYQFTPGNVSTQSNLTINLIPYTWISSQMALKLNFLTYWARNMLNVSSNQVLSSMSYCQPTCTISNMGSFFLVQFNSLTLLGTNISIIIFNILSPATLEPADTITITILQTTYSTAVQSGSFSISSSSPNNLQVLTTLTNSTIGSFVTLTIALTSQDLFSSNDSIIIVMNTSVSMASAVTISNILVASNDFSIQQNSIISLSNFILVTNIPGQFSGSITITNISSQSSIKPVTGNKISFYRNGYLYDQSYFPFKVNQATMNNITLTLASNQANANTNLTASVTLSYGVVSTDCLFMSIDQAITINACNVLSCADCSCQITFANQSIGVFSSRLKITNFPSLTTLTTSIVIVLSIKNPISSNYLLYFTTTDASNYTKQVATQTFPNITQSVIPSSIFTFNNTSNVVYQVTNFTFGLNFSGYSLLNGWMTILMDSSITLLDSSNTVCLVNNNNGACTLSSVNTSILANISISSQTQFYTIAVNNLRNPTSTKYFSFKVSIYDTSNIVYYTLLSVNYAVTTPFQITPQVSSSSCTNSASNNLTVTFPYLPFIPSGVLIIDDSSASALNGQAILRKIVYPINFGSIFSLTITNFYSLEPVYYQLLVVTSDLLYIIFSFNFTVTNCNASSLPIITYTFSGLPQNSGTLSFVINQMIIQNNPDSSLYSGINYLTVLFPSQYNSNISISSNALITSQIGARYFNLTIGSTQPISINIWGFTNVIAGGYVTIHAYSLSQGSSRSAYLVSSNSNTIRYSLSLITNCTFPCKICSSSNNSACLQCYSSATTQYYFLDPVVQSCVVPSSCSNNTFANYTTNTCVVCPNQCLTCTSLTSCLKCTVNYYLLNNSCLTDCPSGYYPINVQQICSPCNSANNTAHCATCITLNVCSTCIYSYNLSPSTKTCVVSCSSTEVSINGTCFSCSTYCSTCQGNITYCLSCVNGYYLLNNTCTSVCPSPYVPSPTTNACVNCSSICLLCMTNPTTCTSCQYPLKLFNSTCISNCPTSYYTYTANNNTLQCLSCPIQCIACISQSNCSICAASYYLYNNSCISSCPISTFTKNVTKDNTTTDFCYPCINYCLTCESSILCSQCQTGYYLTTTLNASSCVSSCAIGEYLSGGSCISCSSNCISCVDSSLCLLCSTSYSLQNSLCVSNCSTGLVSILDTIVLPSSNSTAYVCKSCFLIFQYCNSCITTACSTCQTGYIMNYDQSCVSVCPSGYLNISNICLKCSSECAACADVQNNCTSCSQNYSYYKNTTTNINQCLSNCISGTFTLNGVCTACVSPCLTCTNSSTSCLSCISGFYSLVNNGLSCVSQCPSNSYIYNSQCIYCNSTCSLCDSNGCLTCYPSYYHDRGVTIENKTYYNCYSTCPTNLPYLINNTCYQCPANCQICTTTSCLQCSNETYAYQLYCLTQCPPGMKASSGVCVNITSNDSSNSTTSTDGIPKQSTIPIPFSVSCIIVMSTVFISRLSHQNTSISIAIFSLISFLAILCNLFYLISSLIGSNQNNMNYLAILIVGLIINYINNIVFLFVSKYTLLRDHDFNCWKRGNIEIIKQEKNDVNQPSLNNLEDHLNSDISQKGSVPKRFYTYESVWYFLVVLGIFSSHNIYTIVFSKLFGFSIFKATVSSIKSLKYLNYVWTVALFSHLLCLISGIVLAGLTYPTSNHYLQQIYQSVDLIFLNFICLIFGLLLFRKKRQIWQKQRLKTIGDEENSTKKVIFDHESHSINMNGQVGSQSEVNGKIQNLFDNQYIGSHQQLVGEEFKSSTNEQGSNLYFEKEQASNFDCSDDIKLDNNILWMQINPDEMTPQLVEKGDSHLLEESSKEVRNTQITKINNVLNPDNNLETLDFDKLQINNSNQEQSGNEETSQNHEESSNYDEQESNYQNQIDWEINYNQTGESNIPVNREKKKIQRQSNSQMLQKEEVSNDIIKEGLDQQTKLNKNQSLQRKISQNEETYYQDDERPQNQQSNLPSINENEEHNESQEQVPQNLNQFFNQKQSNKRSLRQSGNINGQNFIDFENRQHNMIVQEGQNQNQIQIHSSDLDYDDELMKNEQEQNLSKTNQINPLKTDEAQFINLQALETFLNNPDNMSIQNTQKIQSLPKREIKTQQTSRKRRNKDGSVASRYISKSKEPAQSQSRQTSRISGLHQLFNQYQSQVSPRVTPNQLQHIVNQQSKSINQDTLISAHTSPKILQSKANPNKNSPQFKKDRRYNNYDSIQQETNELRMSNSAHQFSTKVMAQRLDKEEFRSVLHENDESYSKSGVNVKSRTLNHNQTLPQELDSNNSFNKSAYKSTNIAKINNRLGIIEQQTSKGLRGVTKEKGSRSQATHLPERTNKTLPKNQFSSRKVKRIELNQSETESRSIWKSRLVTSGSKQDLNGTTRIIQRKSKLAEVKAKLESIYLPSK